MNENSPEGPASISKLKSMAVVCSELLFLLHPSEQVKVRMLRHKARGGIHDDGPIKKLDRCTTVQDSHHSSLLYV